MLKVKKVALHGKFRETLPLCGEHIRCPECTYEATYGIVIDGIKRVLSFDAAIHTDGLLWVITCPNCKCTFQVEYIKEEEDG